MSDPTPLQQPRLTNEQIKQIADETQSAEPGRDGYILPYTFARAIEDAVRALASPAPAAAPDLVMGEPDERGYAVFASPIGGAARLTDAQIDAVLARTGDVRYVLADTKERLRLFARAIESAVLSHLAAPSSPKDSRDGSALSASAPSAGESALQDIFLNPALLKMPGDDWEFDDDFAVMCAWGAHGQHTGMTPYFSVTQLRAAFNAGSAQGAFIPPVMEVLPVSSEPDGKETA